MAVSVSVRARAELELRGRRERARLGDRYDWYGLSCPCGLAIGSCREHPRARAEQRPPGSVGASSARGDWRIWDLNAGRGAGKTRALSEYWNREVEAGRVGWLALVNETVKDVRDVQVEGPSGLIACAKPWFRPVYEPSKARVVWPNGAYATIYSAEAPNQLRGPEFGGAWLDELAKWRFGQREAWDNLQFCLRAVVEPRPRVTISTTPQPTDVYREVLADPRTEVTRASMLANAAHLDPDFVEYIRQRYGGTRLGRQEIDGELLEDVAGALWTWDLIEAAYSEGLPPFVGLARVVVAIDPNAGSNDPDSGAECGIVVVGRGSDGRGYVLEDGSLKGTPGEWGARACALYGRHRADRVVAERNNGGDMVEHTLRTVPGGADVPVTLVWATRGSQVRAEPCVGLYEQGRVRHLGRFSELERQMTGFKPGVPKSQQPGRVDRFDALVWALTELFFSGGVEVSGEVALGGRMASYGPAVV